MRPKTICHMATSIDGRTLGSRWSPEGLKMDALFEDQHERLGGGSWIVGRVTGEEFAKGEGYPDATSKTFPREPHIVNPDAGTFGIVLDGSGRIAFGRADIGGDAIVAVLTEAVSDAHLAGLRSDGVSYVFAGRDEIDLALALEVLGRELKLERLLIEGGGGTNGSFLRAGLVDEISLVITPAVDGRAGAPAIFDGPEDTGAAPVASIELASHEVLDGGALWLRYRVTNR